MSRWLAIFLAVVMTGIAAATVFYASSIWPMLPIGIKLILCIAAGIFGVGSPLFWWAKRSDRMLQAQLAARANKTHPPVPDENER